jgi:hypothetical protein
VHFCIFRLDPDFDLAEGGNLCGAPHSMLSRAENYLKGDLYWEEGVQEDSLRVAMGTSTTTMDPFTETKDCVQLAVKDPDARTSILLPFRGLWLHLSFDVGAITPEQQVDTAELLYEMFELNGGLVIPSNVEVFLEDCNGSPTPYQEFYLEFPVDLVKENDVKHAEDMITEGALDGATGSTVFELEVSGRRPVVLGSPCD